MSENLDPNKALNKSCQINEKGDSYVECAECGATAEIGTVIRAGDDVYRGEISAENPQAVASLYQKYLDLAQSVCGELKSEYTDENGGKARKYTFAFTCTAEKMIFELRARNIR
ncbi:MAG: DUF406 family protein [Succinivibrionaceae bacterium]|nr:DUF406 family protein [Succinivibrionaceae bacterium]